MTFSFEIAALQLTPSFKMGVLKAGSTHTVTAGAGVCVHHLAISDQHSGFFALTRIASVILNSNSKQVVVQLPGAGSGPAEGAPMFEIANLELNEGGEIAMMQLNLLGGPKRA
jgi:hypothetical protein